MSGMHSGLWFPAHSPHFIQVRFWDKVRFTPSCWIWTSVTTSGKWNYGHFCLNGQMRRAHRVAYEWLRGPIPKNSVLDHLCDTPRCVNPAHLLACSNRDNLIRVRRTHCKNGHAFDEPNTHWKMDKCGYKTRVCRACNRERLRRLAGTL